MRNIVLFILVLWLATACSSAKENSMEAALERMLGNSFKEVIRDLEMKDLNIVEKSPEIYQAVRGINLEREEIYLYTRSFDAVNTLRTGVAKPKSFYNKSVAGIAYRKNDHWIKVGTGHFMPRTSR